MRVHNMYPKPAETGNQYVVPVQATYRDDAKARLAELAMENPDVFYLQLVCMEQTLLRILTDFRTRTWDIVSQRFVPG